MIRGDGLDGLLDQFVTFIFELLFVSELASVHTSTLVVVLRDG